MIDKHTIIMSWLLIEPISSSYFSKPSLLFLACKAIAWVFPQFVHLLCCSDMVWDCKCIEIDLIWHHHPIQTIKFFYISFGCLKFFFSEFIMVRTVFCQFFIIVKRRKRRFVCFCFCVGEYNWWGAGIQIIIVYWILSLFIAGCSFFEFLLFHIFMRKAALLLRFILMNRWTLS